MLTKLLFTALIIAGAIFAARHQRQPERSSGTRKPAATPAVSPRYIAYGIVVIIVATTGVLSFFQWQDTQTVITIRVINSRTGENTTHQAHKGRLGTRSFETLDGRMVTVADVDRIEIIKE